MLSEKLDGMNGAIGAVGPLSPRAAAPAGANPAERTLRIFGIEVLDTTREHAAEWIVGNAVRGLPTKVGFVNAHCINLMHRDVGYRRSLEGLDRIFIDGIGMRLAARAAGVVLQENVNGTDLFPVLCRHAARAGVSLFLFGAREGVADEAGRRMAAEIPGLVVAGTHHGYIDGAEAEARLIDRMNASGAGIVFVAMGVPAQELWIERNRHRLTPAVIIGVGGLLDFFSGRMPRAPLAIRNAGFEWAWRLALEPRRLAGRYLIGNATFMARLLRERLLAPGNFSQLPAR